MADLDWSFLPPDPERDRAVEETHAITAAKAEAKRQAAEAKRLKGEQRKRGRRGAG